MEKVNNLSLRDVNRFQFRKHRPSEPGFPVQKAGSENLPAPPADGGLGRPSLCWRDSSRFVFRSSQAKLLDGPQENSNLRYKGGVSARSGVSIFPSASGQEFQVLPQAIVRSQEDKGRGQVESGDSRLPLGWVSLFSLPSIHLTHGRLAQLVRATGLHPVGHRFESCAVHHLPLSFFMRHVISVLVENKFGVLARIAGLFSGRGFNIDTLNAGPTHLEGRSRITVTLNGDEKALEQCINQLDKLIDVIEVNNFVGGEGVGRELVLVKIRTDSETRSEVTQLCGVFSWQDHRCRSFESDRRGNGQREQDQSLSFLLSSPLAFLNWQGRVQCPCVAECWTIDPAFQFKQPTQPNNTKRPCPLKYTPKKRRK